MCLQLYSPCFLQALSFSSCVLNTNQALRIRVLSSNYTLYGDMSRRVAEVYEDYSPRVEIYSIDECFLDWQFKDKEAHAKKLVAAVKQRVGIAALEKRASSSPVKDFRNERQ